MYLHVNETALCKVIEEFTLTQCMIFQIDQITMCTVIHGCYPLSDWRALVISLQVHVAAILTLCSR